MKIHLPRSHAFLQHQLNPDVVSAKVLQIYATCRFYPRLGMCNTFFVMTKLVPNTKLVLVCKRVAAFHTYRQCRCNGQCQANISIFVSAIEHPPSCAPAMRDMTGSGYANVLVF